MPGADVENVYLDSGDVVDDDENDNDGLVVVLVANNVLRILELVLC